MLDFPNTPPALAEVLANIESVLLDMADRLERIEARLTEVGPATPEAPEARLARVLQALAATMGDLDLSFTVGEVLDHAALDYELDAALQACGATSAPALGVIFRALRDRDVSGLRLVRDGRAWRLARTSCT